MKKDINLVKTATKSNLFSISWNASASPVYGKNKLIQEIVKGILTLKGSNSYDKEYGERFYSLFGIVDSKNIDKVKETFPILVESLEEKIIEKQIADSNIPNSERLISLQIQDLEYEPTITAWSLKLQVTTADQVATTITI